MIDYLWINKYIFYLLINLYVFAFTTGGRDKERQRKAKEGKGKGGGKGERICGWGWVYLSICGVLWLMGVLGNYLVFCFFFNFTFLTISIFCFIFIFCVFEETHWKRIANSLDFWNYGNWWAMKCAVRINESMSDKGNRIVHFLPIHIIINIMTRSSVVLVSG